MSFRYIVTDHRRRPPGFFTAYLEWQRRAPIAFQPERQISLLGIDGLVAGMEEQPIRPESGPRAIARITMPAGPKGGSLGSLA